MPNFITVADVDALLGSGWAGTGDAVQAVTMANAWLTAKITRQVPEPVPDEIKLAGAQVSKVAAAGGLFTTEEREVISTSVTAGPVTTAKTFAKGSRPVSSAESFALALLVPWTKRSSAMMLKRI